LAFGEIRREERSRIEVIDCFRGIAALGVVLYHYTYRWGPEGHVHLLPFGVPWFAHGAAGVKFFFVVSGFVIFMTLEKCSTLWEFAVRRFARIYPPLLVCALITFIFVQFFGLPRFQRPLIDLLAVTTISPFTGNFIDGVYWSIFVEVKFYIWIGAIYFASPKNLVRNWLIFLVADLLLELFVPKTTTVFLLQSYIPFLTAGLAFYLLFKRHRFDRDSSRLFGAALASYVVLWWSKAPSTHAEATVIVLLFSLFIVGALNWLPRTGLAFIGLVSYPLYLLHQNIGVSLLTDGVSWGVNPLVSIAGVICAIIGISLLVHRYVERPSQLFAKKLLTGRLRWQFS
jgi:peptidoglycan/LPS O-acetylase OafA/YrhL